MKTDLKIPQLSVEGKEVAENILKEFEENMKIRAGDIIKDMFDEFYSSYANYIEQDSWYNIRQHHIDLLCNYNYLTEQGAHTAKRLRKRIYEDFKEEMTNDIRSEEHTSELQSRGHLVCRLLLEKKKKHNKSLIHS